MRNLGSKHDPVDELAYIILSRKTCEDAYRKAFAALKGRFSSTDNLLAARRSTVHRLVSSYWLSHPELPDDRLLVRDMREVSDEELRSRVGTARLDVLAGAPPCQGYSGAGFRSKK